MRGLQTLGGGLLALLLAGCPANSGVVRLGPDTFLVSRQAGSGFAGLGTLKADAIQEASTYCLAHQKVLLVLHTREAAPPYIFGNFPKAEVQFRCLDAHDAALVPPTLRTRSDPPAP